MLAWLSKACSRGGCSQLGPFRCWSFPLQVGPLILFEWFRNGAMCVWFARDPFAD